MFKRIDKRAAAGSNEPSLIASLREHGRGWVRYQPSARSERGATFFVHRNDLLDEFDEYASAVHESALRSAEAVLQETETALAAQLENAEGWTDPGANDYRAGLEFALDTVRTAIAAKAPN